MWSRPDLWTTIPGFTYDSAPLGCTTGLGSRSSATTTSGVADAEGDREVSDGEGSGEEHADASATDVMTVAMEPWSLTRILPIALGRW